MTPAKSLSIADVERITGIARATLRVWEQRYGFPRPQRGIDGERAYPPDQVQQLRSIGLLVRMGHRPAKVVPLPATELRKVVRSAQRERAAAVAGEEPLLEVLRSHDADALLGALKHMCSTLGLEGFLARVASLNAAVGEAWQCGDLQVFEEHVYVEAVQGVLRHAVLNLPPVRPAALPVVVLATPGEEQHGLGLLMAHAMFAIEGCRCVSLGVRVPLPQLAAASAAYRADIVGVSFSAYQSARAVGDQLRDLRRLLPAGVQIWAGGGSRGVLRPQADSGIRFVTAIADIRPAIAQWRAARASENS